MKSTMKIILVTVAILVGLVGCGSGGDDWIVGEWETDILMSENEVETFKFSSEGTLIIGDESPIPYSLSGNILSFDELKSDGTTKTSKLKIDSHDDDSFMATLIGFPMVMEFRKVK